MLLSHARIGVLFNKGLDSLCKLSLSYHFPKHFRMLYGLHNYLRYTMNSKATIHHFHLHFCSMSSKQNTITVWLSNVATCHIPPIHLSIHPTLTQIHSLFQLHLTFGRDYIPPFGKTAKPLNSWTFEIFVMV